MRLLQLQYFNEVCEQGSITKAAKAMHVSQPTVTVAIQELEEELQVHLFHRVKQRIYLTQEGKFFYQELSEILKNLDKLKDAMLDLGSHRNHIRLGIPPMMGTFFVPQLFLGFRQKYPEIQLEISEYGAMKIHELILNDTLDIGLVIQGEQNDEELNFTELRESEFGFYVGKDHPFAKKKKASFSELKDTGLILFHNGFYINKLVNDMYRELNMGNPKILLQTSQIETMKRLVSGSQYGCFLEKDCVTKKDGLVRIALDIPLKITIGLAWKRGRYLYSDVSTLMDYIKTHLFEINNG